MDDQRDYGRLEQKVERLTTDVADLSRTVAELRDLMLQARGGWSVILTLGAVATAVVSSLTWFLSQWRH